MAPRNKAPEPLDSDKALSAMLALLVAEREERLASNPNGDARRTEVILAASGLTPAQIVPLVGKNLEAVYKTIQRGKGK